MKKKFKDTVVGKLATTLIGSALQSIPVVGTIVTNFKENTPQNPKGQLLIGWSELIRIVIGCGLAYLMFKGIISETEAEVAKTVIGI